jgi:hypothetical protein
MSTMLSNTWGARGPAHELDMDLAVGEYRVQSWMKELSRLAKGGGGGMVVWTAQLRTLVST